MAIADLLNPNGPDPNAFYDPSADPANAPTPAPTTAVPWWQQPPPPGYTGQWPPPLPPGGSYGPNLGQVNFAQAPSGQAPPTGTGTQYWDPTLNGGVGGWSNTGLSPVPSAPGVSQYTGVSPTPTAAAAGPTNPTPSGGATTTSGGGTTTTSGGGTIGSLLQPFTGTAPTYQPAQVVTATAPNIAPPAFPTLPTFSEPTLEQARATPGYQFGLTQGEGALQASAAAKGVLNTGGTLEDILKFGQNFADQNFQTVRQNALDDYMTNTYAKFIAPYQAALAQWQTIYPTAANIAQANASAGTNVNLANATGTNNLNFNNWLQQYNIFRQRQADTFNYLNSLSQQGATVQ